MTQTLHFNTRRAPLQLVSICRKRLPYHPPVVGYEMILDGMIDTPESTLHQISLSNMIERRGEFMRRIMLDLGVMLVSAEQVVENIIELGICSPSDEEWVRRATAYLAPLYEKRFVSRVDDGNDGCYIRSGCNGHT